MTGCFDTTLDKMTALLLSKKDPRDGDRGQPYLYLSLDYSLCLSLGYLSAKQIGQVSGFFSDNRRRMWR